MCWYCWTIWLCIIERFSNRNYESHLLIEVQKTGFLAGGCLAEFFQEISATGPHCAFLCPTAVAAIYKLVVNTLHKGFVGGVEHQEKASHQGFVYWFHILLLGVPCYYRIGRWGQWPGIYCSPLGCIDRLLCTWRWLLVPLRLLALEQ